MKTVLIDGNNLAIKNATVNDFMTNSDGLSSGAHYGFFNSLLSLRRYHPDSQFLVVWDSKSKRRLAESQDAVDKKMIKQAYKENRKEREPSKPIKDWRASAHHLKNALGFAGVPQVFIKGYEADDLIASYSKVLDEVLIVTSDKDFYQLFRDGLKIWNGKEELDKNWFVQKYGIQPSQHLDVAAFMGDKGDNIFGVPGWGEKTSLKAIKEHGDYKSYLSFLKEKHKDLREKYPDFSVREDPHKDVENYKHPDNEYWELLFLTEYAEKTTGKGKLKYPEISFEQPFSGLLEPLESKKDKVSKAEVMALMFEERCHLAYSLKKMDDDVEVPEIINPQKDHAKLFEYFDFYDIVYLKDRIHNL